MADTRYTSSQVKQMLGTSSVANAHGRPALNFNLDPNMTYTPEQLAVLKNVAQNYGASGGNYTKSLQAQAQNIFTGHNADGSAVRPEYQSVVDPATGKIKSQYQIGSFDPINLNTQGLDKYRGEAMRTGPSAWANMQNQAIQAKTGQDLDSLYKGANGQLHQGMDALAGQGGLASGARERMAQNSMRSNLLNAQGVRQGANNQSLQVGIQDEQNRINQLGQLPGMEIQALQPAMQNREFDAQTREYDINNALKDISGQNQNNLSAYQTDMAKWAAGKTADAQAKAAGGKK